MDYCEEYVRINDLDHYMLHDKKPSNKVCIFVHGGPGQSFAGLFYYFSDIININMVYYDERGGGRTLLNNKKQGNISLEQLILDLDGVVDYVCKKYSVEQVILLCHSFGSIIGSTYAQRYPHKLMAYIGCGEVVNMKKGEEIGFNLLKKKIGNKPCEKYREYPYGNINYKMIRNVKSLEFKNKLFYSNKDISLISLLRNSPVYKISDMVALLKAFKVNKCLIEKMYDYDKENFVNYKCPFYYILGDMDFVTPYFLASRYFDTVNAPKKKKFIIKDAGHNAMIDNTSDFLKAFNEIIEEVA